MILRENWAVPLRRAEAFFAAQPDVERTEDGFCFGSCRITLQPETGSIGPWPVERVILSMEGAEADLRAVYQRFFMTFLSAGG